MIHKYKIYYDILQYITTIFNDEIIHLFNLLGFDLEVVWGKCRELEK